MADEMIHEFMLGFIKIYILQHASEGPIYGKEVHEKLGRYGFVLSYGTLYSAFHKFESKKYLVQEDRNINGKIRKYYSITDKGLKALEKAKSKSRDLLEGFGVNIETLTSSGESMRFSQRITQVKPSATLELTALANRLKSQGIDVVGFGAGEPDFDTPVPIKDAAHRAIDAGKTKYTPAGGIPELKKAVIAKFLRDNGLEYKPSEVTINCGGKHSFYNLMQVLLNDGDEVIVPAPYWVSYPSMVTLAGGKPVIVDCPESQGFKMTPAQLRKSLSKRTKAVILNSPSNPTGSVYHKEELVAIAEVLGDSEALVISDDIYECMLYDGLTFCNMASISDEMKKRTVVLNGVSKTYSMTGWRIGYMAGDAEIIKHVETLQSQSTSNPTSIAQWAAVEALDGDQAVINDMLQAFTRRRKLIVEGLNRIPGFSCLYPDGAFYAFPGVSGVFELKGWKAVKEKYKSDRNSSMLCSYLLDEARVAVVPGVEFGNDNYLRLSYATSDENIKKGLERITEAINRLL